MIRLFLVDDQSIVRQGLKVMLSLEPDLEVVGMADNGEAALGELETIQPDVVLMDMRMPVMNGITATRLLRDRFPGIKILVLSTYDDDRDIVESMRAGAKGYLLKDMPSEELADAIRCVHRGYTQLAPNLLERVLNHQNTQPSHSESVSVALGDLTPRELEVARFIAIGATNQEIAQQLFISESTVKTHLTSIFNRLNLKNRSQLAIYASSAFSQGAS